MNILYILLALGIIGHAINMYCDRILSIFPNGTLKLANYSKLKDGDYAAKLMEGVSPSVPMRSGVLGVFAIVLEFCGYAALAAYAYQKAPVYGAILFVGTTFACIVSSAYHLKCGLAEYMFLKYGRDERAKGMMLDLMGSGASLRLCSLGMITFYITLMVAIITGAIGFPIWALVFMIFPIFRKRGLKRLRCSVSLVTAVPMQYLLKPEGLMRSVRSIGRMGEDTRPSRLSSMMTALSISDSCPVS